MAFAGADEFFDRTQYEYCLQTKSLLMTISSIMSLCGL